MRKRNDPDLTKVSSKLVAHVIGRSRPKIIQYVKKGILPRPNEFKKYNLPLCVQAYVAWLKNKEAASGEIDARQSVLREKLKQLKLENDRRAGEVVDVEEVEEVFMRVMSIIAMRLEAIPGRMAHELAGTSDPAMVRKRLRHEISDTRTSAESGLKDFISRCKGSGGYKEPSTESARRVGRSKARLTRRKSRTRSMEE